MRISFTGDIMCEHTRLNEYLIEQNGKDIYDFDPIFMDCKELFSKSSYVVGNLETPIAGEKLRYSYRSCQFNTPDTFVGALKKCGIDMLTTANNHALDRGIEGLINTIDAIETYGLDHTGTSRNLEERRPLIKDFGDYKVSFLSFTYGTEACYNMNYLEDDEYYYVNLFRNQELRNRLIRFTLRNRKNYIAKGLRLIYRIVAPKSFWLPIEERHESYRKQRPILDADIEFCKKNSDIVIMCLHSGGQFNDSPVDYTIETINHCLKKGVDLVVCNHEHVVQSCHYDSQNKLRATYCLGNFSTALGITDPPFNKNANASIVLHMDIEKSSSYPINISYSFSTVLSYRNSKGIIITSPIYKLYMSTTDNKEKRELEEINQSVINRFLNKHCNIAMQEEYTLTKIIYEEDQS